MRRAALGAIALTTVLAACGSGNLALTNGIRPDAAKQLQGDVLTLSQAAAAKNWQGARTALSTLRADLDASVSAGAISSVRAAAIEATAGRIAAELPAAVTATPTPTPTTKAVTPKPAPPPKHGGGDHGGGGDGGGGDG